MGAGRLVTVLVGVAMPPLVLFALTTALAPGLVRSVGSGSFLLAMGLLTCAWAAVMALIVSRGMGIAGSSVVDLAERGQLDEAEHQRSALTRAAEALDERNRQIGELARRGRAASISESAHSAAAAVVATARMVTRDPTWTLAILVSEDPALLPAGVYGDQQAQDAAPIEEVHRWAASLAGGPDDRTARHVEGPWGAFLVVDVLAGGATRAVLLALHEGRDEPSAAALDLLTILGEHAAAALEHALLVHRVRSQAAELDRLATLQRDFLRAVSHDLQAPLTSIGALAAEVRAATDDARTREDLEIIAFQTDRLRRMVAQLLTMSRLEAHALQPRTEVFRVEAVIERAWRALRTSGPFELEVGGIPHLTVADPDRLEQIAWAILDNAVKYAPAASPIRVDVAGIERNGEMLSRVAIADLGAGLSDEDRARAFEPFFRSDSARSMAPDGSGIGLATAKGLMEAMGGRIELTSDVGRGTTVTLELPAERATMEAGDGNPVL